MSNMISKNIKAKVVGITTYIKSYKKDGTEYDRIYRYANVIYNDGDERTKGYRAAALAYDESLPIVIDGEKDVTLIVCTMFNDDHTSRSKIVGVIK